MEQDKKVEGATKLLKQFDDLKKKHPDALLLFRDNDVYRAFKEDALKAAAILGIKTADMITGKLDKIGDQVKIKFTEFPHGELDTYLPKLVRTGNRVAICDQLEPM